MKEQSKIKTITKEQHLQLLGLGVLTAQLQMRLIELGRAVQSIVQEADATEPIAYDAGHVSEFVNDERPDVAVLLRKLGITVEGEADHG